MWRGMTPGVPIRSGASFVGLGTHRHRVVFYPISQPDPATGLATINWIAEITVDNSRGPARRRLEQEGRYRLVHPSLRGLAVRLARCARDAARRRRSVRIPDDRPRPGADMGRRPRRAARRRGPRHVPDGLERREPSDRRRARARRGDDRARRHDARRFRPTTESCARRSRPSCCATAEPGRSAC